MMDKSPSLPKLVNFDFNKHLPQSSAEKTSDLFFILLAVYIATSEEKEITRLTLEKALFKTTEILAIKRNVAFLNTFFYVNTYGPHNNMFYPYLEELQRANLVEMQGNTIYLTPKGLRIVSYAVDNIPQQGELVDVLLELKGKIRDYTENPSRAVEETHAQKVLDTTDEDKIKTIQELIEEIKPEQEFKKASQFKYIEPYIKKNVKKIILSPKVINDLESVLANVETADFEKEENINSLFA